MLCSIEQRKIKTYVIYSSHLYIANMFSFQYVDDFVYELSMRETNAEKRRKIGDLTLTNDEWDRIRLFCNLLQVCSTVNFVLLLLIFLSYSMPMTRSKHFPLVHNPRSTMLFQPSKHCMLLGRVHQKNHNMHHLCRHSRRRWRSLMSITRERLNPMRILLQWVHTPIFIFMSNSLSCI
jgi:hypothetical protein